MLQYPKYPYYCVYHRIVKRLAAILFLLLLLFNLCGYRLVIDYLQLEHNEQFTAQLDRAEYADEDLISIKTALSLPYYKASTEFERVDGSIQIDGVAYNYVKRRIINDSLELLCLPNTVKQKLQTAKSDFFKLSNDLQRPENKKSGNNFKNMLPEYCDALTAYALQHVDAVLQSFSVADTYLITSRFVTTPEQPPETMRYTS